LNSNTTVKVGAFIESIYGRGKILAVTDQWIIHDASLEQRSEEYALLIKEDQFSIFPNCLGE